MTILAIRSWALLSVVSARIENYAVDPRFSVWAERLGAVVRSQAREMGDGGSPMRLLTTAVFP